MKPLGRNAALAIVIVTLLLLVASLAPSYFTAANLTDLALENLPVLIVALGMLLVILTGEIDISVGSMFAIVGVVVGLLAKSGLPMALAALLACAVGAVLGAMNGFLVSYLKVPSIVATLATMIMLRNGLRWTTEGAWVTDLPSGFQWLGLPERSYAPVMIAAATLLTVFMGWALLNLRIARTLYATGSNAEAARLAGVDTQGVTFTSFVLLGLLTGIAAVCNAVRFSQIPSNTGVGLELNAIAAVVVGGAAITGGSGGVTGTVLGVILLGAIGPALTFLGINAYWEKAIQGAIILISLTIEVAARSLPSVANRHANRLSIKH